MTTEQTTAGKHEGLGTLLYIMSALFAAGLVVTALYRFDLVTVGSFGLGGIISIGNLLWLRRLAGRLATAGTFTKRSGIEWGIKVLVVFGGITVLILKAPINILIFLFGLSILPIAVILNGLFLAVRPTGGG